MEKNEYPYLLFNSSLRAVGHNTFREGAAPSRKSSGPNNTHLFRAGYLILLFIIFALAALDSQVYI
jgi:hypothetical protein